MFYNIQCCGAIASGKTTLCAMLKREGRSAVYEDFQLNPFWRKFYEAPDEYSFETELTFLLQHYHDIKVRGCNREIICDYSLLQDIAYADVNLTGNRHKIFMQVVEELIAEIGHPSHLIHLICDEDILLQRIAERNREAESTIPKQYLVELSVAIGKRVEQLSKSIPVTVIDSGKVDFREACLINIP